VFKALGLRWKRDVRDSSNNIGTTCPYSFDSVLSRAMLQDNLETREFVMDDFESGEKVRFGVEDCNVLS
jgi:hypothetical protein